MPFPSSNFIYLQDRIHDLENKFINDQVAAETADVISFIPDLDRIAAFKLLVHAEIEDYLEKKAKEWIDNKDSILKSGVFPVNTMLDIFPILTILEKEIKFEIPFDKVKFAKELSAALQQANKVIIEKNNGIKSDSFLKLSLLCGKAIDEIDYTISLQLNEYGKDRGDVAHKSALRARTLQAPSIELKRANDILVSLQQYFYS